MNLKDNKKKIMLGIGLLGAISVATIPLVSCATTTEVMINDEHYKLILLNYIYEYRKQNSNFVYDSISFTVDNVVDNNTDKSKRIYIAFASHPSKPHTFKLELDIATKQIDFIGRII